MRWLDLPPPWCHYPWPYGRMMPSSARTDYIIDTDDIITCKHISREWQDRFLWNLVWTLCHWRLLQTHTFKFPTIDNTVIDAQSHEVGGSSSAMTKLPMILGNSWWHQTSCHLSTITQTNHAAIYQWSCELLDIASIQRQMMSSPMLHLSVIIM
jgi:hypothetical protein